MFVEVRFVEAANYLVKMKELNLLAVIVRNFDMVTDRLKNFGNQNG